MAKVTEKLSEIGTGLSGLLAQLDDIETEFVTQADEFAQLSVVREKLLVVEVEIYSLRKVFERYSK